MDLSKFKRIAQSATHVSYQHPDGHILHMARMADGGQAQPAPQPTQQPLPGTDEERKKVQDSFTKALGLAEGGIATPGSPVTIEDAGKRYKTEIPAYTKPAPTPTPKGYADGGTVMEDNQDPLLMSRIGNAAGMVPTSLPSADTDTQSLDQPLVQNDPTPTLTNFPLQGTVSAQNPANPMADLFNNQLNTTKNALGQMNLGLKQKMSAEQKEGTQEAEAMQQAAYDANTLRNNFEDSKNDVNQETNKFISDLQNQHFDPLRYWHNKSTGSKILTIAGIIMGGFAGPGRNPAMDLLQKNIDRDIDAQKMEFGKSHTLLEAMYRKYGNMRDATAMASHLMAQGAKYQLGQVAAQSKSAMAPAAYNQAAGQLDMMYAPQIAQLNMRQALMKSTQGASPGAGIDPGMMVNATISDPKERMEAMKELEKAQNLRSQYNTILGSFDQANQENTIGGRIGRLGATPPAVHNFMAQVMPYLKDAEGRINEKEINIVEGLIPKPGDRPDTVAEKRQGLINLLQEKSATPVLNANFIHMAPLGSANKPTPRNTRK